MLRSSVGSGLLWIPARLALLTEARNAFDRLRRFRIVRRVLSQDRGERRGGERRRSLLERRDRAGCAMQKLVGDARDGVVETCGFADLMHKPEPQCFCGGDALARKPVA